MEPVSKAEEMKRRICAAVVVCLDEVGYAETSIGRVQTSAGVSRGALTHHFPTKQALMAETATRLLSNAMRPLRQSGPQPIAALLTASWQTIVNTAEGRAFLEILVACRTDADLHEVLSADLARWDASVAADMNAAYQGSRPEADDAALLWSIARAFIRGLLIHERFVDDKAMLTRMMARFADMLAAHLKPR
jgi:AcrR family transcriptional regulator